MVCLSALIAVLVVSISQVMVSGEQLTLVISVTVVVAGVLSLSAIAREIYMAYVWSIYVLLLYIAYEITTPTSFYSVLVGGFGSAIGVFIASLICKRL